MTVSFDLLEELGRLAEVSRAHGDAGMPVPPPEDEARVRHGIRRYVARHPLYREYMRVREWVGDDFRNTEPWMAIAERLQAGASLALANSDEARGHVTADVPTAHMLSLALWLLQATPYLWSCDTWDIANGAPLPKHTISREVLPYPLMFWSLETAYENKAGGDFNWIFVMHRADQIMVVHDEELPPDRIHIKVESLPYGGAYPHDVPAANREAVAMILKMCSFLASPLVLKAGMRLTRPQRRTLQRSGHPPVERDELINVVRLRRIEHPASDRNGDADIDWRHQWWVSGHYRAQWYPSLQAHKVIWIAPHLKGPGDKPLIEKMYAVVR